MCVGCCARLGDRAHIISSEANDPNWIVRIRFAHVAEMVRHAGMTNEREAVLSHRMTNVLLNTFVVSGHPGITDAAVRTEKTDVLCEDDDHHVELRSCTERGRLRGVSAHRSCRGARRRLGSVVFE